MQTDDNEDVAPVPPDLQQWIREAGGYHLIDWAAGDAAVERYQALRRERYRKP